MLHQKIKKGDRVKVIVQREYENFNLVGKIGTVISAFSSGTGKIAIKLDDEYNPYSAKGYFYFPDINLAIVDTYSNNIKEKNQMNNITNYLNIANVKFVDQLNDRIYEYANFEPDLKAGDICVVMSEKHGMGLATVIEIVDRNDIETQREVVAKVYTGEYDSRVALRAKVAELKAKMQERAKKLQDVALYQMLAKEDTEMAALLQEYQSLPN